MSDKYKEDLTGQYRYQLNQVIKEFNRYGIIGEYRLRRIEEVLGLVFPLPNKGSENDE